MSWANLHYDYMGESARRKTERIKHHNGRDHTSHVLKYSIEKSHKNVNTIDFFHKNFHNNKWKQTIAEALWIKDLRPTILLILFFENGC